MNQVTANHFRQNLKAEVDNLIDSHEVLRVKRRRGGDFVVLSADDWGAIEETLYLNRFPGLVESIRQAADEPVEEATPLAELDW